MLCEITSLYRQGVVQNYVVAIIWHSISKELQTCNVFIYFLFVHFAFEEHALHYWLPYCNPQI